MNDKNTFEVGDIVSPGLKPYADYRYSHSPLSTSRKYKTLCYDSEYVVTKVRRDLWSDHALLSLEVFSRGPSHPHKAGKQDGTSVSGIQYDERNMIFVRRAKDAGPRCSAVVPVTYVVLDELGVMAASTSGDESVVASIVADMLRNDPKKSYRVYSYVKTGSIVDLPVSWS